MSPRPNGRTKHHLSRSLHGLVSKKRRAAEEAGRPQATGSRAGGRSVARCPPASHKKISLAVHKGPGVTSRAYVASPPPGRSDDAPAVARRLGDGCPPLLRRLARSNGSTPTSGHGDER